MVVSGRKGKILMDNKNVDDIIKKLLKEDIAEIEVDIQAKNRIKARLGLNSTHSNAKPKLIRKTIVYAAGILLVLGFIPIIFIPGAATAINVKLLQHLEFLGEDKINNVSQTYGTKNLPNSSQPPVNPQEKINLKDAIARLPFLLELPTVLPEGFELTDVRLSGENSYMQITLRYVGPDGNLTFKAKGIIEDAGVGMAYDVEDTESKDISINDKEVKLITNKSGRKLLQWYKQGVFYSLETDLPDNVLLETAATIKYSE